MKYQFSYVSDFIFIKAAKIWKLNVDFRKSLFMFKKIIMKNYYV